MTEDTSNPPARPSQAKKPRTIAPRDRVARLSGKGRIRWLHTLGIDFDRPADDEPRTKPGLAEMQRLCDRVTLAGVRCAELVDLIETPVNDDVGWTWADSFPADVITAHLMHVQANLGDLLRSCQGIIAGELVDAALGEKRGGDA